MRLCSTAEIELEAQMAFWSDSKFFSDIHSDAFFTVLRSEHRRFRIDCLCTVHKVDP